MFLCVQCVGPKGKLSTQLLIGVIKSISCSLVNGTASLSSG